jgi:exodeoxyribonuclease-3
MEYEKYMIKIATYNINSVRLRIERVISLLIDENLDVLCLQETKTEDKTFPLQALKDAGYEHIVYSGEKSYNGVAIISRLPLSKSFSLDLINDQKRHIAATLPDGTEIHNFYIPAGGDLPNLETNPKFVHKLDYVDGIKDWFNNERSASDKMIIVGDFNIAPGEHDVWSHKQLLKIISHTPIELEKLEQMRAGLHWIDVAREFTPSDEKLYSWWSYRNKDWRKSNRGRRLDHIWVTPALRGKYASCYMLPDLRDGEKPSDHVPVVMTITI